MKHPILRQPVATLCSGAALVFGALTATSHADNDTWTLSAGTYPFWDSGNPTAWSLSAAPTATQDAIFPANPGPNTVASDLRPDGTEIIISNLNPANPTPIANNLVFFGNYLLESKESTAFPAPPSFLTLAGGGVSVADQKLVIFDTDVVVTSGTLTKTGNGSLLLSTGWTITGNVLVQGGAFGGTGFVKGDLINHSIVFAGDSAPGTLHVSGNFEETTGATLSIRVGSAAVHDLLSIGGKAQLGGDLVVLPVSGYAPAKGDKITILTAGSVKGTFDNFEAPIWDLLTLRPFYGKNSVTLEAVVASFAALPGLTQNQHAIATNLDGMINDSRASQALRYLYNQQLRDLPRQFDRIAPEELASIFSVSTAYAQVQGTNLQRRTDDIRSGSNGFSAAGLAMNGAGPGYSGGFGITTGVAGPTGNDGKEVKETKSVAPAGTRWGAFLSGTGEWVNISGTENARGYSLESGGFTLGVDYKVTPNFAIGIAAGYTGSTTDLNDHGRVWTNGGKLGLYATYFQNAVAPAPMPNMGKDASKEAPAPAVTTPGGFYADIAAFGGYNSYDTRRGALAGDARGDTDGGEIDALFGIGYDIHRGGFTFGPTASFNYTYAGFHGFTEHGSLAPLDIRGGEAESLRTAFGFKVSYEGKVGSVAIKPELRVAWQHEFGDTTYALSSSFASGAGDLFTVHGPRVGRDSALIGAGVAVQLTERCAAFVYYDGELGRENSLTTAVTGGFRVSF